MCRVTKGAIVVHAGAALERVAAGAGPGSLHVMCSATHRHQKPPGDRLPRRRTGSHVLRRAFGPQHSAPTAFLQVKSSLALQLATAPDTTRRCGVKARARGGCAARWGPPSPGAVPPPRSIGRPGSSPAPQGQRRRASPPPQSPSRRSPRCPRVCSTRRTSAADRNRLKRHRQSLGCAGGSDPRRRR